jgi:hypothetical protein
MLGAIGRTLQGRDRKEKGDDNGKRGIGLA